MANDVDLEYNNAAPIYRKLASSYVNGTSQSEFIDVGKLRVGKEEPPEMAVMTSTRTLVPQTDIVRGATKHAAQKLIGPAMLESEPIQPYGHNLPIWYGWRPQRPELSYMELGMEMPQPEVSRKIEIEVPTLEKIRDAAMETAQFPYPSVSEGAEFADPETWKGYGMGNLGQAALAAAVAPTAAPAPAPSIFSAISNLAQSIAGTVQAKYTAKAAEYAVKASNAQAAAGMPYAGTVPQPPGQDPAKKMPWGTLALVGGGLLAAIFILPQLGGKKRR